MSVLDEVEELKKQTEAQEDRIEVGEAVVVRDKASDVPMIADNTVQKGLEQAIGKTIQEGKEIKDLAKDLTYLKGASDLQENDQFKEVYQAELGKQLVKDLEDEGKRQALINASRKQEAANIRSQSIYDAFKPIFLMLDIESPFGMIPMIITAVLLMIPFLIVSLVMFVIKSIDKMFTAISKFSKPAMWICGAIVVLAITAAVILALLYGVDSIFGTTILRNYL